VDVINAFVAGVMEVAICPVGFSVPTKEELKKDTVDTYNAGNKTVQAFNSFLKIPASGYRFTNNGKESNFPHTVHMWLERSCYPHYKYQQYLSLTLP
jgi:hypothetical protein